MLEVHNLSRRIDGQEVLTGVELTVGDGELVAVLGRSGSGKTSLLRLILGLDDADLGEIRHDGRALVEHGRSLVAAEARGFALVFERTLLLPFADVAHNVAIGEARSPEDARARLTELSALLDLTELTSRMVHTLSAGEQQRVALARALFVRPQLLLLDEPFRNLDRSWRDRFVPRLRDYLRERRIAAILVTHDHAEALAFADRLALMERGRLVRLGSPQELYGAPRSATEAQLLGECGVVPMATAKELLGVTADGGATAVIVRPEQLEVTREPPLNAVLRSSRFAGSHRTLTFSLGDALVPVYVGVGDALEDGGRYNLRLKAGSAAVPVGADR